MTPMSDPGKLLKPLVAKVRYSATGDATTIWPALEPARSITAPSPAKMPCAGNVTAVVNPALRAGSMRLSARLTKSAARTQLLLDGRSSGPRATGGAGAAGGPGAGAAGGVPVRPGAAGAASEIPQVLSASIKP